MSHLEPCAMLLNIHGQKVQGLLLETYTCMSLIEKKKSHDISTLHIT
jgi:hypothetical protein